MMGFMELLLLAVAVALVIGLISLFARLGRKAKLAVVGGGGLAIVLVCAVVVLLHTRVRMSSLVSSGISDSRMELVTSGGSVMVMQQAAEVRNQAEAVREQAERVDEHARVETVAEVPQVPEVPQLAQVLPSLPVPNEAWKSLADLGFDADVHPSAASAAESLVVRALKVKDSSHPGVSFKRVQVWKGENIGSDVLSRVVTRLQREHPDWEVMPEAAEPAEPLVRADEQAAAIQLKLVSDSVTHQAPWNPNRAQHGGIIRLRLAWKGGSLDRSTSFVEKPWVENASGFVSAQPQMQWVVGYSPQDAADSLKAREQAAQSAAVQILPAARARLAQTGSAGVDDRWLLTRIQQDLLQMNNVRDRFTQTVITPYGGQVVREAILVASPATVERVTSDCQVHVRRLRSTWLATAGSAAGMCLLICFVALLLNSITKGYYRGRIVALAGLLLVAGLLVTLKLSGSFFVRAPVAGGPADSPVSAGNHSVEY